MARFLLAGELTLAHHASHVAPVVEQSVYRHYGGKFLFWSTFGIWLLLAVVLVLICMRAVQIYQLWALYSEIYMGLTDGFVVLIAAALAYTLARSKGRPADMITSSVNRLVSLDGVNVGPMKVVADETGLTVEHTKRRTKYKWAAFETLRRSGDVLALQLTRVSVVLLPVSAFKDDAEREAFEAFVRGKIAAAGRG